MMKKLLFTFLVSALIGITLFMTNMTVSASETNGCNSEVQSCDNPRYERLLGGDFGAYYFHSTAISGKVYRGYLIKETCLVGGCIYSGWLFPEPCPYPTPFSEPIE